MYICMNNREMIPRGTGKISGDRDMQGYTE